MSVLKYLKVDIDRIKAERFWTRLRLGLNVIYFKKKWNGNFQDKKISLKDIEKCKKNMKQWSRMEIKYKEIKFDLKICM